MYPRSHKYSEVGYRGRVGDNGEKVRKTIKVIVFILKFTC